MGNWNRRWIPKKKYNYEDPRPSSSRYNLSYSQAIQESNVPSWEIDFCMAAGIHWHNVVTAKQYMYCYDNVVKWDDSAGQEAFDDAKRRYWAKISGLSSQDPPPNPDMYIDKIDWDSNIDPELISDLDREYFNPNEAERLVNSENNLVSGCTLVWEDKPADNSENPWGSVNVQGSKTFEDVGQTWNEWDNPVNMQDDDNPWEKSCSKTHEPVKDTAWGGDESGSWGWNQGLKYENGFTCVNNTRSNSWNQGGESVTGAKGKEWSNNRNGSWGQNHWNTRGHEQWNSENYGSGRDRNFTRGGGTTPKDRGWGESEISSWGRQQLTKQSNERNLNFGRPRRGENTFYAGSRKREGSSQYMSRYKSSRFQGGEQRAAYDWREEKTQKRVTFSSN